jgi:hypothetical protein
VHGIEKVFILTPANFSLACPFANHETIEWAVIIQYKFFYRLLQEINQRTLAVVNERLSTQNRYDLTYSCIRHFLTQSSHQIVFQHLPLIDSIEDFMVLLDSEARSRWKREQLNIEKFSGHRIAARCSTPQSGQITIQAWHQ